MQTIYYGIKKTDLDKCPDCVNRFIKKHFIEDYISNGMKEPEKILTQIFNDGDKPLFEKNDNIFKWINENPEIVTKEYWKNTITRNELDLAGKELERDYFNTLFNETLDSFGISEEQISVEMGDKLAEHLFGKLLSLQNEQEEIK